MITYNFKKRLGHPRGVNHRTKLCFKTLCKKDADLSLSLSLKFGTHLVRSLHQKCKAVGFKGGGLNLISGLGLKQRFLGCGRDQHQAKSYADLTKHTKLTHYAYALAAHHNTGVVKPKVASRFDVIRSPFVFKKTREQFTLTKHSTVIHLNLNPQQQDHLQSQLSMCRLPGELTCVFTN